MPETDFAEQLARLAPEVDEGAAKDVFERHRQPSGTPRWLLPAAVVVLIVAGVTGLVLTNRDDPATPVSPVDEVLRPAPGETLIADHASFEVVYLAETTTGFGNAALAPTSAAFDAVWQSWNPDSVRPAIDFAEDVALVMTRPDNACADVVTQFDVTDRDGIPAWTPVFAEQADACDDPLLSWLYVVTIDRAALGDRADFVIPASELYDVPPTILEYRGVEQPDGEAATVTLTPTDVVVPLPPESEPELHNTAAGMFYVVNHGDGDVSVVPATIDLISPVDPDTTNLMSFVVASESGRSFFSEGEVWDAWGRSTAPERVDDLTGYAGRIVGDEVEILTSDATRVEGDPEVPDGEQYPLPARPFDDGITVEQFFTLSSSGPIWRMFDAQLVVEEGVGRICPVDQVVEPMGCPDTGMVIDTQVRSSNTDLTSWYGSPILAFQDPFRGFTHVVPLAGSSSSNDTVGTDLATDGSVVTSVKIACGGPGGELLVASVGLDLPPGQSRTLTIVDGDQEYGQSVASGSGEMSISFGLLASPPDSAELVVSDGDTEQARIPIPPARPTDCSPDDADGRELPVSSGPDDDVSFRVVSRPIDGSDGEWIGWAVDQAQFGSLMTQFDRVGTSDPIDFESEVALVVALSGSMCGPHFDGLDVVDGVIRPRTTATGTTSCDDSSVNTTVVLAVPRSELDTTVAVGFGYPVTVDDDGSVARFERATGRFVSMGEEFAVTGIERSCTATDAPALRVLGVAPTVIDVDAELSTFGELRAGPVRDTFGPDESSVRIPVPDDVDLTQPVAVTIRTADGARSIVLPPLTPSAIGDDASCP